MQTALERRLSDVKRAVRGIGYSDGQYVSLDEISVSILDFGFIHSDATYDVCRIREGRAFLFDRHLDRFYKSSEKMRLEVPVSRDEIKRIAAELWRRSDFEVGFLWMCLTRGIPESGNPRDLATCRPRFMMYIKPYYSFGSNPSVSVCVAESVKRSGPETIDPRWKNFAWVDLTKAQWEARDRGFDTAILVDQRGYVSEGPGFNIGLVKNSRVMAPKGNALYGVTMQAVEAASNRLGLLFEYGDLVVGDFLSADEVFVTSTAGGVTPVHRFNQRIFIQGVQTQRLIDEYWSMHQLGEFSQPLIL
ncbi:MAG: aminotransferase class IV [Ferrovibrio sp.]